MSISIKLDDKAWKKLVQRIERNLSKREINKILSITAGKAQALFAKAVMTKKGKGTGETALSFKVIQIGESRYEVISTSKAALFLEKGTKAHGPVKKKYLYIPLRPGANIWRKGYVYGKDYVLAKRVKGIKARKYLKPISQRVQKQLVKDFTNKLKTVSK